MLYRTMRGLLGFMAVDSSMKSNSINQTFQNTSTDELSKSTVGGPLSVTRKFDSVGGDTQYVVQM